MQPFKRLSAKTTRSTAVVATALALSLVTGILTLYASAETGVETRTDPAIASANDLSNAFRGAADEVSPSVVMITNKPMATTTAADRGPSKRDFPFGEFFKGRDLHRFFRDAPSIPKAPHGGIGSGVIIDGSGLILTNNHVVAGGGTITVRTHDGREFQAAEVMTDPKTDLAVVRIEAEDLSPARLGDSDRMQTGDWVIALGQPFGLEGTVTAGIISAKGRGIGLNARENYLQTDAAINPGNSGGPLVNLNGEVIGINTAISSSSGGNQGIGFAVPINLAKWVSGQLQHDGTVRRAQLGVSIQPISHELAQQFGLESRDGALVNDVLNDSPAAKAGLKPGDIIVEFAGTKISDPRELQRTVEQAEPGTAQELGVVRDGKRITLTATVGEQTADGSGAAAADGFQLEQLGLEVRPLSADLTDKLKMKDIAGVVIASVRSGSPAAEAGLRSGMVITEVDRISIKSIEEFRTAMEQRSSDEGTLLLVRTSEGSRFVVLPPNA
jgi:serine protease Do